MEYEILIGRPNTVSTLVTARLKDGWRLAGSGYALGQFGDCAQPVSKGDYRNVKKKTS